MDLKPANMLVFYEGGGPVWKLSDLGMSRINVGRRGPEGHEHEHGHSSWSWSLLRSLGKKQ